MNGINILLNEGIYDVFDIHKYLVPEVASLPTLRHLMKAEMSLSFMKTPIIHWNFGICVVFLQINSVNFDGGF